MKIKSIITMLLLALLIGCGGNQNEPNPTGNAIYHIECYSYGQKIFDNDVVSFFSGYYLYEDNAVGNLVYIDGECIKERIGEVEIK